MDGWIKLHRKITEWEWYKDANTLRLFLHLLLKANHKDTKYRGEIIKSGDIVTGRKILAQELALSEQQIRTAIFKLKSTNEITIKSTSHYSIITLNNWKQYQAEQPANQLLDNQQVTTSKNIRREEESSSSKTTNNVVSLTSSLYMGYGSYSNVYLSKVQYGTLTQLMGGEELLAAFIDELSENIACKKEQVFDEKYPNMHFIRLRKYFKAYQNKRKEVLNEPKPYNPYL